MALQDVSGRIYFLRILLGFKMIAAYAIGPSTAEAVHAGHVDMSRGVV